MNACYRHNIRTDHLTPSAAKHLQRSEINWNHQSTTDLQLVRNSLNGSPLTWYHHMHHRWIYTTNVVCVARDQPVHIRLILGEINMNSRAEFVTISIHMSMCHWINPVTVNKHSGEYSIFKNVEWIIRGYMRWRCGLLCVVLPNPSATEW